MTGKIHKKHRYCRAPRHVFPASAIHPSKRFDHLENAGGNLAVRSDRNGDRAAFLHPGVESGGRPRPDSGYVLSLLLFRARAEAVHRAREENRITACVRSTPLIRDTQANAVRE